MMMIRTRVSWANLLGAALLLAVGSTGSPAQARVMDVVVASSGLVVHGIPLPVGAEPTMAANLSFENLRALSTARLELGKGRLRAVIYDMPGAAPPDTVASFYRRAMTRPFSLALPDRGKEDRKPAEDDGIRVLPFLSQTGYLAIHAEQASRPARITVALVEGAAQPAPLLSAVEGLSIGAVGPSGAKQPPLLSDDLWQANFSFSGPQLQLIQQRLTPNEAAGPVVDVMRVLLSQARSLNMRSRRVTPSVSAPEILAQFGGEARRSNWKLLSVDAEAAQDVMALYRQRDDRGMVMLRAGAPADISAPRSPAQPRTNVTEISRLEVTGAINLRELFRPLPPRTPTLLAPSLGPFPPREPFSARQR